MGRIALMARENNRLSAIGLASKPTGFHADGRGLYLSVSSSGSRSWIFRYMLRGRSRDMGLGSFPDITLADARSAAAGARVLCKEGIDPIEQRDNQRAAQRLQKARSISFEECTSLYFEANKGAWRNPQHIRDWELSLKNHVFSEIGGLPVADVDVGSVLKVLEPMWLTTPVTAGRVRGRIESVLAYATARGYREGANPARWRHHLEHLLPKGKKVRAVRHHSALPFDQIASFVSELRTQSAAGGPAFEFLILTAARSGEVLGAKVSEIDFDRAVWTVPAERMKVGLAHQVPLSNVALSIAVRAAEAEQEYLFEADGRRLAGKFFFQIAEVDGSRGSHHARLSKHISRLGGSDNRSRKPRRRNGVGACRRQGRGRLSTRSYDRKEAGTHERLGGLCHSRADFRDGDSDTIRGLKFRDTSDRTYRFRNLKLSLHRRGF
jgi:integrase